MAITLAGKTYELRFSMKVRKEIEDQSKKGLWNTMFSNEIDDNAIFLWGGMKHANRKLTPGAVIDLLDEDREAGGNFYEGALKPAIRQACLGDKIAGNINDQELERVLRDEADAAAAEAAASVPKA